MKVLLINGSPHERGCTYTALCEVEKTLKECGIETEIFWIGNKPIGGCVACKGCIKLGKCAYDDVVNVAREKSYEADGFIFGTPVHWASASGAITSFMDRLFFSAGGKLRGKPAACVTAARRAGTTATLDQLNKYFYICGLPIVPSRYWAMVYGSKPDEVAQDEEGLQIMRALAANMAWMVKSFAAAKAAGIEPPALEPLIRKPCRYA
jgi:multimeric flavodoxin WrbA